MERLTEQKSWKISQGIALQFFAILFIFFAGAFLQLRLGLTGLCITEIILLLMAVTVSVIHKTPMKEVFPVKRISLREAMGLVFFIIGGIFLNVVLLGISMRLIPSALGESSYIQSFVSGYNPILLFVSVVLLPAVCEEALERGAVLSHFRAVGKDYVIVIVMGVFFGLFHLSPGRFLNTMCLGAILSYLMVKKNNILFPVIFHFANNFISILPSFVGANSVEVNPQDYTFAFCFMGAMAPLLFVAGNSLLLQNKPGRIKVLVATALSMLLLFMGVGGLYLRTGRVVDDSIMLTSIVRERVYDVEVTQSGVYLVYISSDSGSCALFDGCGDEIASDEKDKGPHVLGLYHLDEGMYSVAYDVGDSTNVEVNLDAVLIELI